MARRSLIMRRWLPAALDLRARLSLSYWPGESFAIPLHCWRIQSLKKFARPRRKCGPCLAALNQSSGFSSARWRLRASPLTMTCWRSLSQLRRCLPPLLSDELALLALQHVWLLPLLPCLAHQCSHQSNFVVGILIAQKIFDRFEHIASHLLQGSKNDLLTFRINKPFRINSLTSLDKLGQVVHDGIWFQIPLPGYFLDTSPFIIKV